MCRYLLEVPTPHPDVWGQRNVRSDLASVHMDLVFIGGAFDGRRRRSSPNLGPGAPHSGPRSPRLPRAASRALGPLFTSRHDGIIATERVAPAVFWAGSFFLGR